MIVTRFAPSPTGEPHIGNIRTALFAWMFAKKNGGEFFVRIEDTDKSREIPGAVQAIVESLEWLGLNYDKNLIFQSERLKIYKSYADKLVKSGWAYTCTCSEERLAQLREEQIKRKEPPMYDGNCRNKNIFRNAGTKNCVVRLKIPKDGATEFTDIVRGAVRFENKLIDDQVILKSDGYPTYHLANVVDDYETRVTHVIRGEDWLSSTPKHLLIYKYLGLQPPVFAHLPMILGKDKSKLSKRHGAMPVLEYKRAGFLADAFLNYIALLGWHPVENPDCREAGREMLSRKEIIEQFSLERVQKSGAVFDPEKLTWMNGMYMRKLSRAELFEILQRFGAQYDESAKFVLEKIPEKNMDRAIGLVQERMRTLMDFAPLARFIIDLPEYDADMLIYKSADLTLARQALTALKKILEVIPEQNFTSDRIENDVSSLITEEKLSIGAVFHPLRIALTGLKDSPGPVETATALGKAESLRRITHALQKIR